MAYGTLKVDNITFTNGGSDQTITVSGIVQSISGDITATGTIQAATVIGTTTVSGATVTGNVGQFTTVAGGSASFTTVTGTTVTGTTANFGTGVFTTQISGASFVGGSAQFTTVTGNTAGFTAVTGTTVTGTSANFGTGTFTTQVSGANVIGTTVFGTTVQGTTVSGATITGGALTAVSGTFTGNSTAAAFIPTGSTVPTNGVYLPAANTVGVATNGTGRLFVDASGNVGVGNNAPLSAAGYTSLRLNGSTGGLLELTSAATRVLQIQSLGAAAGAQITTIDNGSSPPLIFGTNSAERLRITAAGLVGIGTSAPSYPLHLNATGASDIETAVQNSAGLSRYGTRASGDAFLGSFTAGKSVELWSAGSQVGVIDSSGRLGIGTTSPSASIIQTNQSTATIAAGINLYNSSGVSGGIVALAAAGSGGGSDALYLQGSSNIQIVTGATERARIDSSGRLLVGTGSNSGGALLQVNGNRIRVATAKTPASATDTGTTGEICWDANYIYVCTATNTWKRTAISTW